VGQSSSHAIKSAETFGAAAGAPSISRLAPAGHGIALFLSAAASLVVEIVGGRIVAPYVGMSLHSWTAVITVVLAGLALGHWIGGRWSDGDRLGLYRRLALIFTIAALSTFAILPLLRFTAPMILVPGLDLVAAILMLATVLFFIPSVAAGSVSPILTRIAIADQPDRTGIVIGRMFALGAAGSILGVLGAGYVLIAYVGSGGTILSVALVYGGLAAAFLLVSLPSRKALAVGGGVTLAAALLLGVAAQRTQAITSPCDVESEYYCLRVVDTTAEIGRASRTLVLDHLGHGINDRDDPARLHSGYLALMDRLRDLRQRGGDFDAFFIGGGAYTLPRAWQARFPDAALVTSEIDPLVTDIAREHMWFEPGENMEIIHADARMTLKRLAGQAFDVIIGDAVQQDVAVPPHLVTKEFAATVKDSLAEGGFYALNIIDRAEQPLFLTSVVLTLQGVFPVVEAWYPVRAAGRTTFIVLAGDRPTGPDAIELDGSLDYARWRLTPMEPLARFASQRNIPVLTDDFAPVYRLLYSGVDTFE